MAVIEDEEYFPRGGSKDHKKSLIKDRTYVFEGRKIQKTPKKNLGRKEREREKAKKIILENEESEVNLSKINVEFDYKPLTYKNIREGTLTMCIIKEIYRNYLVVSLPDRLSAKVQKCFISQPLHELIEQDPSNKVNLTDYFVRGYCLPCKVLDGSIDLDKLNVTTDPCQINCNVPFSLVSVGFTFIAAVQSSEDHGYVMLSGIQRLNVFLPYSNIGTYLDQYNSGRSLGIGQLVWCKVIKSKLNNNSNIVEVTINPEEVEPGKLKNIKSADILIPGAQVDVTINKVAPGLLYVNELNSNQLGFVPSSQLDKVWSKTSDYKEGMKCTATVLYKFPHTDIVCYSLKIKPNSIYLPEINKGTLFKRAKVVSKDKRCIIVQLEHNDEFYKGMIYNQLAKTNDQDKFNDLFPIGNHVTVRVMDFYNLDEVYSCSTSDDVLKKGGHLCEFKSGQFVEVVINKKIDGGLLGTIGKVRVFIPSFHIPDNTNIENININKSYKGRVLHINENRNSVIVTLHHSLIKNKPLLDFNNVTMGEEYYGTVRNIQHNSIVVTFFNDLTGIINETDLPKTTNKYKVGEIVKCFIRSIRPGNKPILSIIKPLDEMELRVGSQHSVVVKSISDKGLNCIVLETQKPLDCILPIEHLSDCLKLCPVYFKKYKVGMKIENCILYTFDGEIPIFTLRPSVKSFFENNKLIEFGMSALKNGVCIPATVHHIDQKKLTLEVPVPGFNGKVICNIPKQLKNQIQINQGINVITQHVDVKGKQLSVFCQDKKLGVLQIRKQLKEFLRELSNLISRSPGEEIKVKVLSSDKDNIHVLLPDGNRGIITRCNNRHYRIGEKFVAIFLYEDLVEGVLYFCNKHELISKGGDSKMKIVHAENDFCIGVTSKQVIFLNPINSELFDSSQIECKIPFIFSNFSFAAKEVRSCGKFKCGFVPWWNLLPSLLTSNVIEKSLKQYAKLVDELDLNESSNSDEESSTSENEAHKFSNEGFKRKSNEESLVIPEKKSRKEDISCSEDDEEISNIKNKEKMKIIPEKRKHKLEIDDNSIQNKKKKQMKYDISRKKIISGKDLKSEKLKDLEHVSLEDVGGFDWNATPEDLAKTIAAGKLDFVKEDSDEEIVVKKKLTPAERRAAKIEEERKLREIEEEIYRNEENPQSAEQFDRLLLANPNNSKLWIQYMAFHLQGTDVEKARSVARRALKHINIREEQEKFNVWIALLNLENLYGSAEYFEQTLSEALKYNNDYQIYIKVLTMYCDSQKITELDKLINHLVRKFKHNLECWLECQSALMSVGLTEKARNFLQRSLASLPPKEHITLISRFALLENKYGFNDHAQSLFENLLTSYPQRVDIWNVYTDMLVKCGSIDTARNVLQRITSHKLPVRKMRTIYKKWLQFEEKYGTKKSLEHVKKNAENYVTNLLDDNDKKSKNKENIEDDEHSNNSEDDMEEEGDDFGGNDQIEEEAVVGEEDEGDSSDEYDD